MIKPHYNVGPLSRTVGRGNREVNPESVTQGLLNQIKYPTKGSTHFEFENNTIYGIKHDSGTLDFSAQAIGTGNGGLNVVGAGPIEDQGYVTQCSNGCIVYRYLPFTQSGSATVFARVSNDVGDDEIRIKHQFGRVRVFSNGQAQPVFDTNQYNKNKTWNFNLNVNGPGYLLIESWGKNISTLGVLNISYSNSYLTNLPSAGVRIKEIANYTENGKLASKKIYDYNKEETEISSAVLTNDNGIVYSAPNISNYQITGNNLSSTVSYSLSSISRFGTENTAVIYSNVREIQVDSLGKTNGYTRFEFSTGGNYMRDEGLFISQNASVGKLIKKSEYGKKGNSLLPIRITKYNYIDDSNKISILKGFKITRRSSINVNENPSNPTQVPSPYAGFIGINGVPNNAINNCKIIKYDISVPWRRIGSERVTENIYNSSYQITDSINTTKIYNYNNPNHLQLSSQITANSLGETLETKYYYPGDVEVSSEPLVNDLVLKNILVPLKIQSFKSGNKLNERKTVYKNWGNNLFMPELIQGSKGNENPETRVRFVNINTSNGNVQQLRQENGIDVTYLWGYNGVYPIAKVEGASFAQILSVLGITEQNIGSLTAAPANIRSLLPNAMVTTYTYKPLVGVSTITDPKGDTVYYNYDSQGRLITIRDNLGNILSENTYHYRPN